MDMSKELYNALKQLAEDIIDRRSKLDTLQAELLLIAARIIEEADMCKEATQTEIRAIELVQEHFKCNGYTTHANTLTSLLDSLTVVER